MNHLGKYIQIDISVIDDQQAARNKWVLRNAKSYVTDA